MLAAISSAEADVAVAQASVASAEADLRAAKSETEIGRRQLEELDVLLREVLADDSHEPHAREERRAHREVARGTAENRLALFPGGWGVREFVIIEVFLAVGLSVAYTSQLFALSLLHGFSMAAWSLLGGIFLFSDRRSGTIPADVSAEEEKEAASSAVSARD